MDEKPEPPADDDSPGRPMPGVPAADAPTVELADPGSLLSNDEFAALGAHTNRFMALLAQEGIRGDIRLTVIDDTEMSRQHEVHKNTPGTTDVLTFDLAPDNDTLLDADILICADEGPICDGARARPRRARKKARRKSASAVNRKSRMNLAFAPSRRSRRRSLAIVT